MINFSGTYFDGVTSKPHPVSVSISGNSVNIRGPDNEPSINLPLSDCQITPPLSATIREIILPNGGRCETTDLEAMEALDILTGANRGFRFVHFLENNWKTVTLCLGLLVVFTWLIISRAIPLFATGVAYWLPQKITNEISQKTLDILEKRFFKKSELDHEHQAQAGRLFQKIKADFGEGLNYKLLIRNSKVFGPNALALPSGKIIFTDDLIELADKEEALAGIMVHEMAHVKKRHGLRVVLQNAGVFLVVAMLVGDAVSITSIAATVPTLLVETGYTRKFEMEADREAGEYLMTKYGSTREYQEVLRQLGKRESIFPGKSFLSTHPGVDERIMTLKSIEDKK